MRWKRLQINSYKYVLLNISKTASKMSAAPFPFLSPPPLPVLKILLC